MMPRRPDADSRQLRREHLGVANHRGVAFQARGLARDVGFDVLAAHFFFALDQELHIDRQPPMLLQQPLHGFDQDVGLAFIVGRPTRVDIIVANVGLKRRRFPFVQRIGRLHVVMPVEQHGGLARRAQPFGVDQRIPFAFDQLRLLQSGALQLAAHEFGRALDVRLVLGSVLMLGMRRKVFNPSR